MINGNQDNQSPYSISNFLPLIIIGLIIIFFTVVQQILYGFNINHAMSDFMGSFFIVFSSFKIINLKKFVEAYSTYDIIAQRYHLYAYIYPFLEFMLGILYLMRYTLLIANWITLLLMIISSIGVGYALSQKRQVVCACLGAVFKIPMTYVTLAEDILMGTMALIMLVQYYMY